MSDEQTQQQTPAPENDATQDYIENLDGINIVPQEPYLETPVEENAQTPAPAAEPNAPQANPEDSTQTPQDPSGTPPVTEPENFNFMTTNEAGEEIFDEEAAIKFATAPQQAVKEPVEIPTPAPAVADPLAPVAPEPTYNEAMTSNVMAGFDYLQKYIDMGYDTVMATHYAKAAVEADLQKHFNSREMQSFKDEIRNEKSAAVEEAEFAKLEPLSRQNINQVVTEGNWGTAQRLQDALFSKDIGGNFLTWMYKVQNPGKTFTSGEEYGKELQKFYTKLTSTHEGAVHLSEYSRSRIFMNNKDKMMGIARTKKQTVDTQNRQSNMQSTNNKQTKASQTPVSDTQGLGSWLDQVPGQ